MPCDRRVALTLSTWFLRRALAPKFLELMLRSFVDVVFANQAEVKALYRGRDIDAGVAALGPTSVWRR